MYCFFVFGNSNCETESGLACFFCFEAILGCVCVCVCVWGGGGLGQLLFLFRTLSYPVLQEITCRVWRFERDLLVWPSGQAIVVGRFRAQGYELRPGEDMKLGLKGLPWL